MEKATPNFYDVLSSLNDYDKVIAENLHEYTLSMGFIPKISTVGKRQNDWKCEYKKNKTILYILRITNGLFSIRCKLFNLEKYNDVLESCNINSIETLLKNSKDCENHGGGCKGPVAFSIKGKNYSKCRHYLMFKELKNEDINGIKKLFECENTIGNF
jgi:hypothetical protein